MFSAWCRIISLALYSYYFYIHIFVIIIKIFIFWYYWIVQNVFQKYCRLTYSPAPPLDCLPYFFNCLFKPKLHEYRIDTEPLPRMRFYYFSIHSYDTQAKTKKFWIFNAYFWQWIYLFSLWYFFESLHKFPAFSPVFPIQKICIYIVIHFKVSKFTFFSVHNVWNLFFRLFWAI